MRILLVEDEHRIATAIKQGLEQEAYAVDVCFDGDEGYRTACADEYDLILLDVMMPGIDGITLCQKLRQQSVHTSVLLLTAKDQPEDIVRGLDAGADDYLPKPFSFEVLLARMRALLRRPQEVQDETLRAGDLSLSPAKRLVVRAGKRLNLSAKEYGILEYLMRNQGRVVSKNNIMSHVWDFDADILPNNVEVFITYLRAKVDKPFKSQPLIRTVRGFGYSAVLGIGQPVAATVAATGRRPGWLCPKPRLRGQRRHIPRRARPAAAGQGIPGAAYRRKPPDAHRPAGDT
jgi:two-component system, OmpR family, response regulator